MRLENNLLHQLNAVNAVCGVFAGVDFSPSIDKNKCKRINLSDSTIKRNIQAVQNGDYYADDYKLPDYYRKNYTDSDYLNIDVKMETGTGKTYVYTRTMFELHKHYGINKFILLVPTVPIKEGVKAFLKSSYMKTDLQALYNGTEMYLHVLDPQKKVKGRKMFPTPIVEFANGTDIGGNRIDVLLVNSGMLTSSATMGASYDQTLLGNYTQPYETLREIAPFVIIDEPHKFARSQKTFKCLLDNIKPQCVIRYGATFPEVAKGKFDYENVVYNLGSCDAFNNNLIKGVEVEYIAEESKLKDQVKVKVLSISANKGETKIVRLQNELTKKAYDLTVGQSLAEIDDSLTGIMVDTIEKGLITLSNGMELHVSDAIYPQVFSDTYQKTMLSLALDRHFEKERENFKRLNRIKTLSLFFIDSIDSFRDDGYLRKEFEELLKAKLTSEIGKLATASNQKDKEYKEFLEYSLAHISETIAAYFSEDNSTDSEEVRQEVNKVLREKDKIIRIKDDSGKFEPTRFIFSKWTLKEGWDNPNVFVIAKLRSSGSETSKLQEVGRGLRLPVDEFGNRISDEQMYLRYIIDYSEKDFADRLKKEINGDANIELKITKEFLEKYAKTKHIDINQFLLDIMVKRYINPADYTLIEENMAAFMADYPDLFKALANGKVVEINNDKNKNVARINIREDNFKKLEKLWKLINQKYYLHFEKIDDETLKQAIVKILEKGIDGRSTVTTRIARTKKVDVDGSVDFEEVVGNSFTEKKELTYSTFLKETQAKTNIPIKLMHAALCEYFSGKTVPEKYFCKQTLQKFVDEYRLWFISQFNERYSYEKVDVAVNDPLCDADGKLKKSIVRTDVGQIPADIAVLDKYLYDACCYDSQLERENITTDITSSIAEIEVFGKIPKRTVRIPTYADGTYSPDFMYIVKKKDGSKQLNLVVETKDKTELDPEENRKIDCAKKLFEEMQREVDNVRFRKQLRGEEMVKIIEELF